MKIGDTVRIQTYEAYMNNPKTKNKQSLLPTDDRLGFIGKVVQIGADNFHLTNNEYLTSYMFYVIEEVIEE